MKSFFLLLIATFLPLAGQEKNVFGKSESASYEGKIVRITVGESDLAVGQSFKFMERTLERAKDEGAKAVIFDLDTPGGLAFPTQELMTQIADLEIPTVSFVNPKALSAGSFIAISTDRIYMTPGSLIGSSGIVSGTGGEIDKVMRAKLESFFGAHMRYIAEKKGHRQDVIEAMMVLSEEPRQIGPVLVAKNALLNLNSTEATSELDGKPLLAVAEIADLDVLLEKEGWSDEEVVTAKGTGFERIAWWVSRISPLLIMLGLAGGYFELKTPGFGLGGIVSITAFSLFFFGNYMAGNMAGYELAAIFVVGLGLIAVEIFILPGFGIPGILGLLMVIGSLVFSMVDKVNWNRYQWEGVSSEQFGIALTRPALNLSIGIFGSLLLLYLMMKFLPNAPFMRKALLPGALASGTGMVNDSSLGNRVGMTGVAQSDLRPSGMAQIEGDLVEVIAQGKFLDKGQAVRVIAEDGMGIQVEAES